MSRTFKHIRLFRLKKNWAVYQALDWKERMLSLNNPETMPYPDETKSVKGRSNWANKKRVTRRMRHKAKDALRHDDYDRVYRKWDGNRKIKTGYGS